MANTPSRADGAAQPGKTWATSTPVAASVGGASTPACMESLLPAATPRQDLKSSGRTTFPRWEKPGAGEQHGCGSALVEGLFQPSLWGGGAQESIPALSAHTAAAPGQGLAPDRHKTVNGIEALCDVPQE